MSGTNDSSGRPSADPAATTNDVEVAVTASRSSTPIATRATLSTSGQDLASSGGTQEVPTDETLEAPSDSAAVSAQRDAGNDDRDASQASLPADTDLTIAPVPPQEPEIQVESRGGDKDPGLVTGDDLASATDADHVAVTASRSSTPTPTGAKLSTSGQDLAPSGGTQEAPVDATLAASPDGPASVPTGNSERSASQASLPADTGFTIAPVPLQEPEIDVKRPNNQKESGIREESRGGDRDAGQVTGGDESPHSVLVPVSRLLEPQPQMTRYTWPPNSIFYISRLTGARIPGNYGNEIPPDVAAMLAIEPEEFSPPRASALHRYLTAALNHPVIVQDLRQFDDAKFIDGLKQPVIPQQGNGQTVSILDKLASELDGLEQAIQDSGLPPRQMQYLLGKVINARNAQAGFGQGAGWGERAIFTMIALALSALVIAVNIKAPDNQEYQPFVAASYTRTVFQIVGLALNPRATVGGMGAHLVDRHSLYTIPAAFFAAASFSPALAKLATNTNLIIGASVAETVAVAAANFQKEVRSKTGELLAGLTAVTPSNPEAMKKARDILQEVCKAIGTAKEHFELEHKLSDPGEDAFNNWIGPFDKLLTAVNKSLSTPEAASRVTEDLGPKLAIIAAALIPAASVCAMVGIAKNFIAVSDFVPDTAIVATVLVSDLLTGKNRRQLMKDYKNYANTTTLATVLLLADTLDPKWRDSAKGVGVSSALLVVLVNFLFGSGEVPQAFMWLGAMFMTTMAKTSQAMRGGANRPPNIGRPAIPLNAGSAAA